jgi:hypothetical protein
MGNLGYKEIQGTPSGDKSRFGPLSKCIFPYLNNDYWKLFKRNKYPGNNCGSVFLKVSPSGNAPIKFEEKWFNK